MCRSPLRERVLLPDYTPVFYGVLGFAFGHFRCKNDSRYRSWRPNSHRHHRSLQVSSLAQDLQCPLRPLLYDWHSQNPSPAFEFPWLQELHTHIHGEVAVSILSVGFRLNCQYHLPEWFIETLLFHRSLVTLGLPGLWLSLVAILYAGAWDDQSQYPEITIESFVGQSSMGLLCPPAASEKSEMHTRDP